MNFHILDVWSLFQHKKVPCPSSPIPTPEIPILCLGTYNCALTSTNKHHWICWLYSPHIVSRLLITCLLYCILIIIIMKGHQVHLLQCQIQKFQFHILVDSRHDVHLPAQKTRPLYLLTLHPKHQNYTYITWLILYLKHHHHKNVMGSLIFPQKLSIMKHFHDDDVLRSLWGQTHCCTLSDSEATTSLCRSVCARCMSPSARCSKE